MNADNIRLTYIHCMDAHNLRMTPSSHTAALTRNSTQKANERKFDISLIIAISELQTV